MPISSFLAGSLLLAATIGDASAGDKQIIGWIERAAVTTDAVVMEAKVDTGADYSSVHADDIRYLMHEDVSWVEFAIHDHNGKQHVLRRPLMRMSRIKKKTNGFQERPVVMLEICVGDRTRPTHLICLWTKSWTMRLKKSVCVDQITILRWLCPIL